CHRLGRRCDRIRQQRQSLDPDFMARGGWCRRVPRTASWSRTP
ncbi:MAG: hypothetical protein AVDCRST_MAG09-1253, partial [uncultured Sphingomonas sp.]